MAKREQCLAVWYRKAFNWRTLMRFYIFDLIWCDWYSPNATFQFFYILHILYTINSTFQFSSENEWCLLILWFITNSGELTGKVYCKILFGWINRQVPNSFLNSFREGNRSVSLWTSIVLFASCVCIFVMILLCICDVNKYQIIKINKLK